MTGFNIHAAAIAGVGRAKIEDPRVAAHESRLIGDIAAALKRHMPRATSDDVVNAVIEHYRTSADVVTGEAVCQALGRQRQREFRAEQAAQAVQLTAAEKAQMDADWDAIRQWDCDECGSAPGVWCINSITKQPVGEWMPGHPSRIRKAMA